MSSQWERKEVFTGIIEEQASSLEVHQGEQAIKVRMERPSSFDDIKEGDSIACNGVCLTIESFDQNFMDFTIGFETLQITGWKLETIQSMNWNLERSLKFGDRIHGHLVSGHVDGQVELIERKEEGECLILEFDLPQLHRKTLWKKSSVTLNGVSLTVNEVEEASFSVCLIPETLKKTNLETLKKGDWVNIETDYYMKGLLNSQGEWNA